MAVYLDKSRNRLGRMIMCHMIADSESELHIMAVRLGLKRAWFQDQSSVPHYDVCLSNRKLALKLGAVELNRREFVEKMREIKDRGRIL